MRSVTALALVIAMLAAACGDGDDPVDAGSPDDATSTVQERPDDDATSTGDARHEWCDTWSRLRDAAAPGEAELRDAAASAPDSIRDELASLAAGDPDPGGGADDLGQLAGVLGDLVAVEAWSHEHCGTAHPFCLAWPAYNVTLSSSALSGEEVTDEDTAAFEEMARLAIGHGPADLDQMGRVLLGSLGEDVSDEQERAAEAAHDSYDAWVEGNCEG